MDSSVVKKYMYVQIHHVLTDSFPCTEILNAFAAEFAIFAHNCCSFAKMVIQLLKAKMGRSEKHNLK